MYPQLSRKGDQGHKSAGTDHWRTMYSLREMYRCLSSARKGRTRRYPGYPKEWLRPAKRWSRLYILLILQDMAGTVLVIWKNICKKWVSGKHLTRRREQLWWRKNIPGFCGNTAEKTGDLIELSGGGAADRDEISSSDRISGSGLFYEADACSIFKRAISRRIYRIHQPCISVMSELKEAPSHARIM